MPLNDVGLSQGSSCSANVTKYFGTGRSTSFSCRMPSCEPMFADGSPNPKNRALLPTFAARKCSAFVSTGLCAGHEARGIANKMAASATTIAPAKTPRSHDGATAASRSPTITHTTIASDWCSDVGVIDFDAAIACAPSATPTIRTPAVTSRPVPSAVTDSARLLVARSRRASAARMMSPASTNPGGSGRARYE